MQGLERAKILFIAGFGPIVRDTDASRKLYDKTLEIPFKEEEGGYLHTDGLPGAKTFALSCGRVLFWQEHMAGSFAGAPGLARVRCSERREGHCGARIDGLSNAYQEQAGAMGSDSEPVPGLRWNPGRAYLYSVDARKEVAGSQSKVRSQISRTEILHGWLSISKPISPGWLLTESLLSSMKTAIN
jgi:hypothetical protein